MLLCARFARWCLAVCLLVCSARASAQGEPEARAVVALQALEAELFAARTLRASLDERAALEALGRAEEAGFRALRLRSSHRWLAEVYLERGVAAAQAGAEELARSAFLRAASLDPGRRLAAAEAPPSTVALFRAAHEAVTARAPLPFSIDVSPNHAEVFVDGVLLAAQSGAQRGGPHVILVRAHGYAPYADVIELADGPRARTVITLEPLVAAPLPIARLEAPKQVPAAPAREEHAARRLRWPWWVAGGVAIAAGAVAVLATQLRPEPAASRTLVVESGELPH